MQDFRAGRCETDAKAQADLELQLKTVTEQLDGLQGDLAAAQVDRAGTEAMLQEYTCMAQQLHSQLEERSVTIVDLQQSRQKLQEELSIHAGAQAAAESKLADECHGRKAAEEKCESIQLDLARVQVWLPLF